MRNEDKGWHITTLNNDYWDKILFNDDLPITVTRNSLRQFVLEILKEKGLLQEDNQ